MEKNWSSSGRHDESSQEVENETSLHSPEADDKSNRERTGRERPLLSQLLRSTSAATEKDCVCLSSLLPLSKLSSSSSSSVAFLGSMHSADWLLVTKKKLHANRKTFPKMDAQDLRVTLKFCSKTKPGETTRPKSMMRHADSLAR